MARLLEESEFLSADSPIGQISPGAASVGVDTISAPKRHFVFLLQNGLTMTALSSAIEPLRIANQLTSQSLYSWEVVSEDGENVRCSNGLEIGVQGGLRDLPRGSNLFVCSGVHPENAATQISANWVSKQWMHGCCVGSICTGAYTLAKAGLLTGKRFTLHWENIPGFIENFPHLAPESCLYTHEDRIVTCSGGTASTDLFTKYVLDDFGEELAMVVTDMCLRDTLRSGDKTQKNALAAVYGCRNPRFLNVIRKMQDNIEEPVKVDKLASEANVSLRQLERLFRRYANSSPARFYCELRIKRARALLVDTDMSVQDVALATGFNTSSQFSRHFKREFGIPPGKFAHTASAC